MTKSSNRKGKGEAKSTPKPKKPGHCDHGKKDNGRLCAACYVDGTGGEGIRRPCPHGVADNGNRCVECYQTGEGGAGICPHLKRKDRCKQGCDATEICTHGKNKQFCTEGCGGSQICEHGRGKSKCKDCNKAGEGHICEHGNRRSSCRECKGSDYCEHGKQKTKCDQGCGGSQICEHGRQKYQCPDCDGTDICEHKKQKNSCADCNERFCICCEIEKTAAVEAMCQTCLSKVNGTSVEEIHLTSMMCHALYGNGDNLGEVSVQKINGSGIPFDMVFTDISEESVIVVEHDPVFYHDDNRVDRDTKKVKYALDEGCVIIRHRHVECPKLSFEHDDFHLVEFDGYSSKKHSGCLAVSIVEYMINMGVLNESCMEKAFYFLANPDESAKMSYECANEFIRKMVLG